MMCSDEQIHAQMPPVLEDAFTTSYLHELQSLLQSDHPIPSTSCSSDTTTRCVYSVEEKKRRRRLSNRESARRSRWRKKKQIEDLTNQVNRLKFENWELKNRLLSATHACHAVRMETNRLMAWSILLRQKLAGLSQTLPAMQQPV